jgi:hypothetical protein
MSEGWASGMRQLAGTKSDVPEGSRHSARRTHFWPRLSLLMNTIHPAPAEPQILAKENLHSHVREPRTLFKHPHPRAIGSFLSLRPCRPANSAQHQILDAITHEKTPK